MRIDVKITEPYTGQGRPSTALSQADKMNRQRRMGGDGEERWRGGGGGGRGGGGGCSPVRSCRVGRWWRTEIRPPFFPSIHP